VNQFIITRLLQKYSANAGYRVVQRLKITILPISLSKKTGPVPGIMPAILQRRNMSAFCSNIGLLCTKSKLMLAKKIRTLLRTFRYYIQYLFG